MRLLTVVLPLIGFPLFAANEMVPEGLAPWMQGGAFGMLCLVLLALVFRVIPGLFKSNQDAEVKRQEAEERHLQSFQTMLATQQGMFQETLTTMANRFEQQLTAAMQALVEHLMKNG